jgi:eukaryotic-like serine/threonine-protein kinase
MPASLSQGVRLGPYQIVEALGSGGMGEVYLGRDIRLDRQVAIKILPPTVADDPVRLHRFVREAKTASALSHPNIAHVYEIGEADGVHFLVMEYVRGEGLDRRIGAKGLPPQDAVAIASQIADALDEAHNHGVVHRDLKPANVMITVRGRVKVLDFGLAKVMPVSDSHESNFSTVLAGTSAGFILGTLDYMSPEQVRGLEVDRRTDIFSFGVLLYQMVTGHLPFTGASRTDTVYRITQAQPEAMSRHSYDVPPDLERIVRRCLEKDPSRRYQSAHELLLDLTHLRPEGSGSGIPVASPTRKHPLAMYWLAGTALVGAAMAVGASGAVWVMRERPDVIESIAVVPRLEMATPAEAGALAEGIARTLVNSLTQLPNVRVAPRQRAFAAGASLEDPFAIAQRLGVHALLLITVESGSRSAVLDLQLVDAEHSKEMWGKEYTRSVGEFELARETISDEVWNVLRLRLNAEDRRALEVFQLYQRGRYLAARRKEADLRAAIDLYDQALQRDRDYALAHAGKAEALNLLAVYGFGRPQERFPAAKAAAERALAIDDGLAEAHTTLAWVQFRWDWDFAAAGREFATALSLAPEDAQARHWAGVFETAMGRFDDALARLQEAQEIDPVSVAYRADVGWTLVMARRYEEAMLASVDNARSAPGSFMPLRYLGMASTELRDFDRAVEAYQSAIRLEGSNSVLLKGELAHVYAKAGRHSDAQRQLAELLSRRDRNTYVSPYVVALVYAGAGDHRQALDWLELAFRERDNMLPWIKVDPRLDSIRQDPRFTALMAKMQFD